MVRKLNYWEQSTRCTLYPTTGDTIMTMMSRVPCVWYVRDLLCRCFQVRTSYLLSIFFTLTLSWHNTIAWDGSILNRYFNCNRLFLVGLNVFESKQRCIWVGQINTVDTRGVPVVPAPPLTHTHSNRYYHIVFKGDLNTCLI